MRVQHTDLKKLEWPIFTGSIQIIFCFFRQQGGNRPLTQHV